MYIDYKKFKNILVIQLIFRYHNNILYILKKSKINNK